MELSYEELSGNLHKYFGHKEFRKGQDEIISAVLNGKDSLIVMPTGGGKSLCYQLPAILLPGTALIISPLIALMKDQVDYLERMNIPSTFINSSIPIYEARRRNESAIAGEYKILYVAPERLDTDNFRELAERLN
ncbi:MAG: ATP-dependent helicase RecQ, partial [Bacteroidota bacterium]|nr:ATP-dependent helicase RecQ [Bacteroidota bacterium]